MNKKHDLEEFSDLTNLLINVELDETASKARIFNCLKYKMDTGTIQPNHMKKDDIYMRKNKWKAITVSAIAIISLCGAFSSTSFAQEMLQSILARFEVGNMEITQYEKELPDLGVNNTGTKQVSESRQITRETPKHMTVKEARVAMGINFPAPTWLAENYKFMNCVPQGESMVEMQYEKAGDFISLLISRGAKNGISTTDEVKTETIGGKKVYFANGIVIWEYEGFTYELYQMAEKNLDKDDIGKIIDSLSAENE